jgi:ABC-2 type transport system permease protein
MNLRRVFAVTLRLFQDFRNDRRTLALIFIAPIFAMFVFGLAFSGDVKDISVIIVNQDKGFNYTTHIKNTTHTTFISPVSDKIISNLDKNVLKIKYNDNVNHAVDNVKNGDTYAAIIFPKNFTKDFFLKIKNSSTTNKGQIIIRADESVVNIKNAINKAVLDAISETMKEEGINQPITIHSNPVYGENAGFIDFFVPGIMAFIVYLLTTLLTLLSFVGERTSGTLERLLATPLTEGELITGYAITFGILGTIQSALLLTIALAVFKIIVIGNVFLAFFVIALLAIVSMSLGILLSSLAKREAQAVQFIPFIILPVFLLSGVFWPVEAIPQWLQPISYLVPTTYAVEACRAVILKGWTINQIWKDILALIIFAIIILILANWSLKRRKD